MKYEDSLDLIGHTPIVRLRHIPDLDMPNIYLKLEKYNLGGSIKDRAALAMVRRAQSLKEIDADTVLIEPTSGNTGISLALIGCLLGIKVTIVMPESMSKERQDQIRAYGAALILTPGTEGMKGAIEKASALAKDNPHALILQQFENVGNVDAHYQQTAQEILKDVPEIGCLVAGIGTGGTITGVGRAMKEQSRQICVIGVEPTNSAVLQGKPPGPHGIQGIGAGFKPSILDMSVIDEMVDVDTEEAKEMTKRLASEEGLLLGISSGAAVAGALKKAASLDKDQTMVVIAPDGGEKYMSTNVFEGNDK